MTASEKHKAIAVAFAMYFQHGEAHKNYDRWLLTEEGKRLTQDESMNGDAEPENEEEVKWLRAAMETQYEAYEALAKETAQDIKGLKQQLDRMEGNMKLTKYDETLWDEKQIRVKTRKE